MPAALFGLDDGPLNMAVNLLLLLLVFIWLALAYWTWADARRRISDPVVVATATVASLLLPFVGTILYTIVRPPEFLADAREREVETQASELRMRHLTAQSCPRCEHPIERVWLRCPQCQHRLKDPCRSCNRPVDPRWAVCPYCETAIRRPSSTSRSVKEGKASRSRSSASGGTTSRGSDPGRSERDGAAAGSRRAPAASDRPPRERPERSSQPAPAPDGGEGEQPRRRSTATS